MSAVRCFFLLRSRRRSAGAVRPLKDRLRQIPLVKAVSGNFPCFLSNDDGCFDVAAVVAECSACIADLTAAAAEAAVAAGAVH